MKQFHHFLVLVAALLIATVSCQQAPFLTMTGPRTFNFTRDGGSQSFTFSCNRDWSVSSTENWVTVSPSSGTAADGEITVKITCAANNTYDGRSATVTVRTEELSETVTVTQDTGIGLIVSPTTFDLTNAAQDIEIEVQKNVQYSIAIDEAGLSWIKAGGTKALTTDKITFHIAENEDYDGREGKITFKQTDGPLAETVKIKQAYGEGLVVEKTKYEVSNEAQTLCINVSANVEYEVSTEADWVEYVETKALSASTVVLNIKANTAPKYRTGEVVLKQKDGTLSAKVSVTQEPLPLVTTLEPTARYISAELYGNVSITDDVPLSSIEEEFFYWSDKESTLEGILKNGYRVLGADSGGHLAENFQINIFQLKSSSTYYYVAGVKVSGKEYYGKVVSFETKAPDVAVTTQDASPIGPSTSVLNGEFIIDDSYNEGIGAGLVKTWFMYSESESSLQGLLANGKKIDANKGETKKDGKVNGVMSNKLISLEPETTYYYVACVSVNDVAFNGNVKTFKTKVVAEGSVDLGLSVCWATCNLGATKPEEYGDYFAWGETEPKDDYRWETYKWMDSSGLTKYNNYAPQGVVDNKSELDLEDDAAHVKLGGKWRTPKESEIRELVSTRDDSDYIWEWKDINGHNGWLITYVVNDKSIFLPAAGVKIGTSLNSDNVEGFYWSSTCAGSATAYRIYILSYDARLSHYDRYWGQCIRPVID